MKSDFWFEVVDGVEGDSLYATDKFRGFRVSGPKPWGGGVLKKNFTVDQRGLLEMRRMINLALRRHRAKLVEGK